MRTTQPPIAAIAFGVLFSIPPASADPEAIARQSGDHWANCNAEGWLSMRSEDSFIFGPNWKAEGKLEVTQFINWAMSELCADGKNTTVINGYATSGNLVQIVWTDDIRGVTGTDTLLIENGEIAGQTVGEFPIVAGTVAQ